MEEKVVYSKYKYAKISPKKVWRILDLIRGKPLDEALRILKFDTTKAAKMSLKVLETAAANAKNSHNLDQSGLMVAQAQADAGPSAKRSIFSGRGRYSRKLKRTSHITVGLSEGKKS